MLMTSKQRNHLPLDPSKYQRKQGCSNLQLLVFVVDSVSAAVGSSIRQPANLAQSQAEGNPINLPVPSCPVSTNRIKNCSGEEKKKACGSPHSGSPIVPTATACGIGLGLGLGLGLHGLHDRMSMSNEHSSKRGLPFSTASSAGHTPPSDGVRMKP